MQTKRNKQKKQPTQTNTRLLLIIAIALIVIALLFPKSSAIIKKKSYSYKLKNFYTMMRMTLDKVENEYDLYTTRWDYSKEPTDFFYEYLSNFITYKTLEERGSIPFVFFKDGSLFYIEKSGCMDFVYDVNGKSLPNIEGRDRYRFIICPSKIAKNQRLKNFDVYNSLGEPFTSRNQILEKCKENSSYCSALLRFDGWQYSNDYPYRL